MPRRVSESQWRTIVRDMTIAADLPRDYHVDVRLVAGLGDWGLTHALDEYTGRFLIEIERDVQPGFAEFLLIHEFAHVLDWTPARPSTRNHGPTHAVRMAEIYCNYYQVR
jgi:hypothetical protein